MIFDLAILGGGPAGYVAAERAGRGGLKVILFEPKNLGGVCLNEGCIPTKTLLYSTKIYDYASHGSKYGIIAPEVTFSFSEMMARKNKVVKKLVSGVGSKMKKHGVLVVNHFATISEKTKDGIKIEAGSTSYLCKNLLVCTGSESMVPPIPGIESCEFLTSREILQLESVPKSLTIIGGGVIGIEFANIFATLGTKVTIIEMLDEILTGMDSEISALLRKEFTQKGIEFKLKSRVTGLNGKTVTFESNGVINEITSDQILLSVGRKANIKGIGLENIGIELNRGGIKIDENCRTNIPGVYAAGDVTGFSLLAHTASREAEVAVNHIMGVADKMRYHAIPGVVYTNPEVSGVGLTEESAKAKGIEIVVHKLPMVYAGRFVAENDTFQGLCKVIAGKKYGEILGVHMIGNPSSEMIYGACMAIEAEFTIEQLKQVVFPHPTVSEIFRETAWEF